MSPSLADLSSGAHVLVLSAADTGLVEGLAAKALLIVALAPDVDVLRSARRALAAHDNVMVIQGTPQEIPWQEHFFDLVVDNSGSSSGEDPAPELRRVLTAAGRVCRHAPVG